MYDTPEWKEYSAKFLIYNPKCYSCGDRSRVTDHIEAAKNKKELFWKIDNYLPLCSKCHNTITAFFDRYTPPRTQQKLEWISANRLKHEVFTKVKIVPIKYERKCEDFIDPEDFTDE